MLNADKLLELLVQLRDSCTCGCIYEEDYANLHSDRADWISEILSISTENFITNPDHLRPRVFKHEKPQSHESHVFIYTFDWEVHQHAWVGPYPTEGLRNQDIWRPLPPDYKPDTCKKKKLMLR